MTPKMPIIGNLELKNTSRAPSYDCVIVALGYEKRARNIAEVLNPTSGRKLALGFKKQHMLSYHENYDWFTTAGFHVDEVEDEEFTETIRKVCTELEEQATRRAVSESVRLLIDISSFSRVRLASLIEILRDPALKRQFSVEFLYTLALYSPPPEEVPLNSHVGPVLPSFAGWSDDPDRGVAAIVGLGYEQDKALGAVEHVQAAEVWTYAPKSEIREYERVLSGANRALLESVSKEHQLSYEVGSPLNLYAKLESLVYRLGRERNVILFPFGPKLFALCSLLVACYHSDAAVWRVSAEDLEPAIDRLASKFVYGIKAEFPASTI